MDDLVSEFITETSESLSVLDMELVKLEQNPNDEEILGNIFRLVHTIKGTCGFLGLPRLESVAHAGENVLGKIRDNEIEVTPEIISIVLDALDRIKEVLEYLEANGEEPEGSDQKLIDDLNAFAGGKQAGGHSAPAGGDVEPEGELEGGLSREELDELEAAFAGAESTLDGGDVPADAPKENEELEGGLSRSELDELEAAFAGAESTVEGGEAPASVPEPVAKPEKPKEAVSEKTKEKAVAKGLKTDAKEAPAASLANQSIRVNLDVLENLMQMVGELVLTRNQIIQIVRNRNDNELKAPLQHLSHITTELQEGVMKTRMQPIGNAWAKFPRLIRDLSIDLSKKIELRMEGAETELDRQILELIKDPLTHMVRNSCDHGLETTEERELTDKPETGTVTLRAFHEGGHIIIEIADDGRGVNIAKVKEKAAENGVATMAEMDTMPDQQIMQFIFKAGFSTAEKVTSVSGRGVGMDVVRTNIEKIGGTVELSSVPGEGSVFHIKIPLTLAIVSVLIVESKAERFAIPQINVLELVRSSTDSEHQIETINESPVLRLRDKLLPLISLGEVLNLPDVVVEEPEVVTAEEQKAKKIDYLYERSRDEQYIVVCRVGGTDFGVVVDRIFDTEEIVVKPVSELLKDITVFSGNTILGDGSVIMILDPNGLARINGDAESASSDEQNAEEKSDDQNMVSFLLFSAGAGAPKAVPLELVSRLEEIDVKDIELSGESHVIQYRGDLMRLTTIAGMEIPDEGVCEVIVFTYDHKTIGLVVNAITDIVQAPLQVKMTSSDETYIGSMVLASKTTDVVDVGYLLRDMISDLAEGYDDDHDYKTCQVMLVEDSIFFQKLTVPLLKQMGHEVTVYISAVDAMEALQNGQDKPDIIVTDIEMPRMDGFQFAEKVRSYSKYEDIPIIAFTSTVNQQFVDRSQLVGMNDMILKTERETLLESIEELLEAKLENA